MTTIKQLTLIFPHGATPKQCDYIAFKAQKILGCGVSEGGYSVTQHPLVDDNMKFSEDEMTYVYGHRKIVRE